MASIELISLRFALRLETLTKYCGHLILAGLYGVVRSYASQ